MPIAEDCLQGQAPIPMAWNMSPKLVKIYVFFSGEHPQGLHQARSRQTRGLPPQWPEAYRAQLAQPPIFANSTPALSAIPARRVLPLRGAFSFWPGCTAWRRPTSGPVNAESQVTPTHGALIALVREA